MHYIRGCEIKQIDIAQDFYEAYDKCWTADNDGHYLSIPAFVNGFFACEIYLKILTDNSTTGHDLYILFKKLSNEKKIKLREYYERIKLDGLSFDEFLKKIKYGFEYWRYIYEDDNKLFEEKYPFQYSKEFLEAYLPVLKVMAEKHFVGKWHRRKWKYSFA